MARTCHHHRLATECWDCQPAPALNVDRRGMPRDFATYMWLLYKRRVRDESPLRLSFLFGGQRQSAIPPSQDTR